ETSEYLEGPPDAEERYRSLMERFFKLPSENKTFAPSRPPRFAEATTTIDQPGRMTVIQGLYKGRRLPAFLIEQMITRHPKLGRQPTPEDRKQFGSDLAWAMWRAVMQLPRLSGSSVEAVRGVAGTLPSSLFNDVLGVR